MVNFFISIYGFKFEWRFFDVMVVEFNFQRVSIRFFYRVGYFVGIILFVYYKRIVGYVIFIFDFC